MKTLVANMNLDKIDEANLFINSKGERILDYKIIFKDGKFDSIAFCPQTFKKENRKDENDDWIKTPILGYVKEAVYKKEDEKSIESDTKDLPF